MPYNKRILPKLRVCREVENPLLRKESNTNRFSTLKVLSATTPASVTFPFYVDKRV